MTHSRGQKCGTGEISLCLSQLLYWLCLSCAASTGDMALPGDLLWPCHTVWLRSPGSALSPSSKDWVAHQRCSTLWKGSVILSLPESCTTLETEGQNTPSSWALVSKPQWLNSQRLVPPFPRWKVSSPANSGCLLWDVRQTGKRQPGLE